MILSIISLSELQASGAIERLLIRNFLNSAYGDCDVVGKKNMKHDIEMKWGSSINYLVTVNNQYIFVEERKTYHLHPFVTDPIL